MTVVDYVAFGVPLIFLVVLWKARSHYGQHPLALGALVLLTIVSVLHFDVGMVTTDPYEAFLDDVGAPARTWSASVIVLILLSLSGDAADRIGIGLGAARAPARERAARGSRARPATRLRD